MAESKPVRPGGPLPSWQLFEPQVVPTHAGLQSVGVRSPDGRYHSLSDGEEMVFAQDGSDRTPMVRLVDGQTVPFSIWETTRRERYQRIFEQLNPTLGQIYLRLVADHPEILDINLTLDESGRSIGCFTLSGGIDDLSGTIFLSKAPDDLMSRVGDRSIELIADSIGVPAETIRQNPVIFQAFTLFHEFGHAWDYISNWLNNPEVYQTRNPATAFREHTTAEMQTMLFPGLPPHRVRELIENGKVDPDEFLRLNKRLCRAKGIKNSSRPI